MMDYVIVLFLITTTPDGVEEMPFMIYDGSPSALVACQAEAASRNKTIVQRYKFTCMRDPETEI